MSQRAKLFLLSFLILFTLSCVFLSSPKKPDPATKVATVTRKEEPQKPPPPSPTLPPAEKAPTATPDASNNILLVADNINSFAKLKTYALAEGINVNIETTFPMSFSVSKYAAVIVAKRPNYEQSILGLKEYVENGGKLIVIYWELWGNNLNNLLIENFGVAVLDGYYVCPLLFNGDEGIAYKQYLLPDYQSEYKIGFSEENSGKEGCLRAYLAVSTPNDRTLTTRTAKDGPAEVIYHEDDQRKVIFFPTGFSGDSTTTNPIFYFSDKFIDNHENRAAAMSMLKFLLNK